MFEQSCEDPRTVYIRLTPKMAEIADIPFDQITEENCYRLIFRDGEYVGYYKAG